VGLFSFGVKGVWRGHPTYRDLPLARNRSPNAPRLFSPAFHPNRDGLKTGFLFRLLARSGCTAVERGSAAINSNRDTRRRRGCAGFCALF